MVNHLTLLGLVGLAAAVPNHVVYYGPPPTYAYESVKSSTSAEGAETISKATAETTSCSTTTEAAYTGIPSSFQSAIKFTVEYPSGVSVTTSPQPQLFLPRLSMRLDPSHRCTTFSGLNPIMSRARQARTTTSASLLQSTTRRLPLQPRRRRRRRKQPLPQLLFTTGSPTFQAMRLHQLPRPVTLTLQVRLLMSPPSLHSTTFLSITPRTTSPATLQRLLSLLNLRRHTSSRSMLQFTSLPSTRPSTPHLLLSTTLLSTTLHTTSPAIRPNPLSPPNLRRPTSSRFMRPSTSLPSTQSLTSPSTPH
jgi:hypothetical protein